MSETIDGSTWSRGLFRERAILAGTVIGLCDRFLSEDAVRRLIDMARTTTPFDDLLAEMLAKGRAEGRAEGEAKGRAEGQAKGRAEGKADAIVQLLRTRFGQPSPDLTAKIVTERDLARLDHWFALACQAPSLAEFERQRSEAP